MAKQDRDSRDVFISFHKDSTGPLAERIYEKLTILGIPCWYSGDMPIGANWPVWMQKALHSCGIFVALLDAEGVEKSIYMENEAATAVPLHKESGVEILCYQFPDYSQAEDNWAESMFKSFQMRRLKNPNSINESAEQVTRDIQALLSADRNCPQNHVDSSDADVKQVLRDTRTLLSSHEVGILPDCRVVFLDQAGLDGGESNFLSQLTEAIGPMTNDSGFYQVTWQLKTGGSAVRLNCVYFSAQNMSRELYRCFLTKHTVYVLTYTGSDVGEISERRIAERLKELEQLVPGCPVLLAGLNRGGAYAPSAMELDSNQLRKANPAVCGFLNRRGRYQFYFILNLPLSADGQTDDLAEFKACVLEAAETARWKPGIIHQGRKVFPLLLERREDFVSRKVFSGICTACGITDRGDEEQVLNYLRDLGMICWTSLNEYLCLDSKRLMDFMNELWLTASKRKAAVIPLKEDASPCETLAVQLMYQTGLVKLQTQEGRKELLLLQYLAYTLPDALPDDVQLEILSMKLTAVCLRWEGVELSPALRRRLISGMSGKLDARCSCKRGLLFCQKGGRNRVLIENVLNEEKTSYHLDMYIDAENVSWQKRMRCVGDIRDAVQRILPGLDWISLPEKVRFYCIWRELPLIGGRWVPRGRKQAGRYSYETRLGETPYQDLMDCIKEGRKKLRVREPDTFINPAEIFK